MVLDYTILHSSFVLKKKKKLFLIRLVYSTHELINKSVDFGITQWVDVTDDELISYLCNYISLFARP